MDPLCLYSTVFSLSFSLSTLEHPKLSKSLQFTRFFPRVSLGSTILYAAIYTHPITPTWQIHMVLISWNSLPCPSIVDEPAPIHPLLHGDPSTFTQQEQPLLPQWYILNKAGDTILLGYVASKRWLGHTVSDSDSWGERLHTESNILPRVRKRKMINKCPPSSERYTLAVWPWVSHLAQIQITANDSKHQDLPMVTQIVTEVQTDPRDKGIVGYSVLCLNVLQSSIYQNALQWTLVLHE